ncbi:MAG: heparan N-sulfatase [Halioglobus sp.]|nr:heparan N-sulfatase [Halioglobus sp.]
MFLSLSRCLASLALCLLALGAAAAQPPNILLITVDDMNADSVGVFGSAVAGTTPSIDRLAAQGMRFELAHVQVANCMPSRNVMLSGRYPHSNGIEGFDHLAAVDYPTLPELLAARGYYTAILGKVNHATPYMPYPWDRVLDEVPEIAGRERYHKDPQSYALGVETGIEEAAQQGRPFLLLINVSDPHVPLYGYDRRGRPAKDPHTPSHVFAPGEIVVPGYLPDDPVVREEVSRYYSAVRRADDAVGRILGVLEKTGVDRHTLVLFLSDHGMPLPFSKTQLYHHSTRTPLIMRWPGVIAPRRVDDSHMVSAVDILPTLLESLGEPLPQGLQGRSFYGLLGGDEQAGRDSVFKVYNENGSGTRTPMRAVQTRDYLYIFNPWSDGHRRMHSATLGTNTFTRMRELAQTDPGVAARVNLLLHRAPEELYDLRIDPDCLHNLVNEPDSTRQAQHMRTLLAGWMRQTGDPMFATFQGRSDPAVLQAYMREQNARAQQQLQARKAAREREREEALLRALEEVQRDVSGAARGGADHGSEP